MISVGTSVPWFHVAGLRREFFIRDTNTIAASNGRSFAPKDCVLWLHGTKATGLGILLQRVPENELRMDVAPTGLLSCQLTPANRFTTWGIPGQPNPAATPHRQDPMPWMMASAGVSKFADLYFVCKIIEHILAQQAAGVPAFLNIKRFWIAGMSKGASLGWAAYAFNNQAGVLPWMRHLSRIEGYWLSNFGWPKYADYGWDLNTIDWASLGVGAAAPVPSGRRVRPCGLWHGGLHTTGVMGKDGDGLTQKVGYAESWVNTAAFLLAAQGSTAWNTTLPNTDSATGWHTYAGVNYGPVCVPIGGPNNRYNPTSAPDPYGLYVDADAGSVRCRYAARNTALGVGPPTYATAPLVEYEVIGGFHRWTGDLTPVAECVGASWDTAVLATQFFVRNGLGSCQ